MADVVAFLSYVHSDDDHDKGRITRIRERLEGEVQMHTGKRFQIFQDRNDLAWGQNWEERIDNTLGEVTFLIPVVTPSFIASPACRKEYLTFLDREKSLGTNQLILPLYYLNTDEIEDQESVDEVAQSIRQRQYSDWRALRFFGLDSVEIATQLANQAVMIKDRMREVAGIMDASQQAAAGLPTLAPDVEAKERSKLPAESEASSKPPIYKIFTREFDEIVQATSFLNDDTVSLVQIVTRAADRLKRRYKVEISRFSEKLVKYRGNQSAAVAILLDNSGSLRGEPISYMAAWATILAETFEGAGFHTDVTGFTTRAWKGGQAREKWLLEGRPPAPGRLNDLRYINYKDFTETFASSLQNFSVMLKEGLLKENIDGEALLFTKEKLEHIKVSKRMMIVISDGAPVDDSTLSVNDGAYLQRHLNIAVKKIMSSNIELIAVGVDHDVTKTYYENGVISNPQAIGSSLFDLMEQILF